MHPDDNLTHIVATLLTCLAAIISSTTALLSVLRNGKRIGEVYRGMNSRLDQLLAEVSARSYREGFAAGQDAPRPDDASRGKGPQEPQ